MTVGELRKALEGVPDNLPVAHKSEGWFDISDEARILQLIEPIGMGDYIDPDIYGNEDNKPTCQVFAIE